MKPFGYRVRAVIFDFDGTLSRPGALDFKIIRKSVGCPDGVPVLEYIDSIDDRVHRQAVQAQLEAFELQGARDSSENPGASDLIAWLQAQDVPMGIISRNSRVSVMRAMENFNAIWADDFSFIITRDDPLPPKPSAEGIIWAAERLNLAVEHVLVVGDYIFDSQAGRAAGAITSLLDPQDSPVLVDEPCDFRIRSLDEVKDIVADGLPLPAGKLPNAMLERYLKGRILHDPSVILQPGVGQDVAAVDVRDDEVVVLKSDPITFATDAIGHYAVVVNANDIVTCGAVPRWLLTTLLLPNGVTPSQVEQLMDELFRMSASMKIALCGGHTEITDAVNRPVVVGMMVGTVRRQAIIDKQQMQPGDEVILTKGVAIEGTAILAREFARRLKKGGIEDHEIETAQALLEHISIWPEAAVAAEHGWATAMHDVTEGGLATALEELSQAGGHRIRVHMEKIPILPLTRKLCAVMDLNPLGLIGSGALLICCPSHVQAKLRSALKAEGIPATRIGVVLGPGSGIEALDQGQGGQGAHWPRSDTDEIARLF